MPDPKLATYEDLIAFTDSTNKRAELIHGVIVEKDVGQAGPASEHGFVQARLLITLGRRFDRQAAGRWPGGWWFAGDLDMHYGTDEVFCHDLIGWRRERMPEPPSGRPQRLRPDWACEILSPSTERNDVIHKMPVLHRAEVAYFWIVRPGEKTLLVHRWTPDGYVVRCAATSGDVVRAEPFDAVELPVAVIFGDQDDEE